MYALKARANCTWSGAFSPTVVHHSFGKDYRWLQPLRFKFILDATWHHNVKKKPIPYDIKWSPLII